MAKLEEVASRSLQRNGSQQENAENEGCSRASLAKPCKRPQPASQSSTANAQHIHSDHANSTETLYGIRITGSIAVAGNQCLAWCQRNRKDSSHEGCVRCLRRQNFQGSIFRQAGAPLSAIEPAHGTPDPPQTRFFPSYCRSSLGGGVIHPDHVFQSDQVSGICRRGGRRNDNIYWTISLHSCEGNAGKCSWIPLLVFVAEHSF